MKLIELNRRLNYHRKSLETAKRKVPKIIPVRADYKKDFKKWLLWNEYRLRIGRVKFHQKRIELYQNELKKILNPSEHELRGAD